MPVHYVIPPPKCPPCMPPKKSQGGRNPKDNPQSQYSKASQSQSTPPTGAIPKTTPIGKNGSSSVFKPTTGASATLSPLESQDFHSLATPLLSTSSVNSPIADSGEAKRSRDDRNKDETTPSPEDQPLSKKITIKETPSPDLNVKLPVPSDKNSNITMTRPSQMHVRPQYSKNYLKETDYCVLDSAWVRCFRPDVPYTLEELQSMGFQGDAKGRLRSIKEEDCEPLPDTVDALIMSIAQLDDLNSLKLLTEEATKGYATLPVIHKYLRPLLGLSGRVRIQRETYRAMERIKAFIEGSRYSDNIARDRRARETLNDRRIQADTLNKIETVCESVSKNAEQLNQAFKQLEMLRSETKSTIDKTTLSSTVPQLKYQQSASAWKTEKYILDLYLGTVTFTKNETTGGWDAKGDRVQVKHPDICHWKTLVSHIRSYNKAGLLMFTHSSGSRLAREWLKECNKSKGILNREETYQFISALYESL